MKLKQTLFAITALALMAGCNKKVEPGNLPVQTQLTSADRSNLMLEKTMDFSPEANPEWKNLEIDPAQTFQSIDGFGFALTGGSAYVINRMPAKEREGVIKGLFGPDGYGVSYLRISIGASDLDAEVFSYDDLPAGQTDTALTQFSIARDTVDLIPVLKSILAYKPALKIMGSPWSPPTWMKDNGNSMGGTLLPQYYGAYALYFVKYIQAMKAHGITIDAVTPQNEPHHGGNNPSMVFSATQEADFIKNHLGPAFEKAGITTKIVIWDHNCNEPDYPIAILDDPAAKKYIDGSAFHLYEGEVSAMGKVHDAHPDKNLYFTEQWTGAKGDFGGDLMWHMKNVIIGTMQNWSRIALEWNLASDPNFNPHTPGGCSECKGAVTVEGSKATLNVSFYIIAHAAKYVTPGSVRIGSNTDARLSHVAFKTPEGKIAVLVLNEEETEAKINLHCGDKWVQARIPARSVGTYAWKQ